jgi:hypothetical protein
VRQQPRQQIVASGPVQDQTMSGWRRSVLPLRAPLSA